jgi:nitric oxide reductase NorD protein
MSINLDDYRELHADLGEHPAEVLRASWNEATRVLSRQGLESYLRGAQALHALKRGAELVATYIQEAPEVARELGEDIVPDLVQSALSMASKTSASVIALMLATSPVAAKRLGDPVLFRAYLQFLHELLAQAPRGVRPLLEHLDPLLGQLTLGGLRRWALWGAQAHRTDFVAQQKYFSLQSADALSVLQRERKGTLFVDVQRRLGMYLRALWGRDFFLRPTSGDFESREGYRPYIEDLIIHVPDAYDDFSSPGESKALRGLELYRAAVAHAAAHIAGTTASLSAEGLNPLQIAVIGIVEDARVEQLAIGAYPGLAQLWRPFHLATPGAETGVGGYFNRLARALLDPGYVDPDPWIAKGCLLWHERLGQLRDNQISWDIGVALAHDLSRLRLAFNPRTDLLAAPYRDDNRYLWEFDELTHLAAQPAAWPQKQVRKHVSLMEFVNEVDVETAGDDAQEIWVLGAELYDDNGKTFNEREGKPPVAEPVHYPEWDYQIQLQRPSWCTVLEKHPSAGDSQAIDAIIAAHKPLVARLKYLIEAMQPQGVQRLRKQEDGDDIDINAAVRALVDLKSGHTPDPRINIRNLRHVRDLCVLLLLDLSESTNEKVNGGDATVLDLSREATALLADAMAKLGDPFAIHGFASNGRHEIEYRRFKDFDQNYGRTAKARLAAMSGGLSTRMGAAFRHAGAFLRRQPQSRKLLLVLTDGEPADIDVRDPQYLRQDAKNAVEELARAGIATYCVTLDTSADEYVPRIFGVNRYMVLDKVQRLPERLPLLYVGLTR